MDQQQPAAPNTADPSRAGLAGARGVMKHTILSNPRGVAVLFAVLVIVIVVLAYMLWKEKKANKACKDSKETMSTHPHWQNGGVSAGDVLHSSVTNAPKQVVSTPDQRGDIGDFSSSSFSDYSAAPCGTWATDSAKAECELLEMSGNLPEGCDALHAGN